MSSEVMHQFSRMDFKKKFDGKRVVPRLHLAVNDFYLVVVELIDLVFLTSRLNRFRH